MTPAINPEVDLTLTRQIKASPATLWKCFITPELLCEWFVPAPWKCADAVIEPHPGGRFFSLFKGPEGEEMANEGAVLLAEPEHRLVFTDFFKAGFVPNETPFMLADITLTPKDGGTEYKAIVRHRTPEDCQKHADMGFDQGWGAAADQLATLAENL
ncbi:SRPBCC family protein [Oceanicola sp. 502str15]|uniref:SRPBCC family protein n=1 Tax=Oceanicola sp. 502str15 TaxID=2696061 RepID=UPI0020940449|nr:SRPBCC family protein [Oceanicola sp. 502str15]MCO6381169.1 polyketide cyclase [Oceanicola sp. 502str15]